MQKSVKRNILLKGTALAASAALVLGFSVPLATASESKSSKNINNYLNNPDLGALSAAAINTLSYSDYGFTVKAKTTETYDRESKPWLEIDYDMGLRYIGNNYPKVSVIRTVSSYGEVVPEIWPYTTLTWGSVATGGYGSRGTTVGWRTMSTSGEMKPVTRKLLASMGNPNLIFGPAQAISNAGPKVIPYGIPEAKAWSEESGVTPWGIVIKTFRSNGAEVDKVTKTVSGKDTTYTVTFIDPWGVALQRTLTAIVRDGVVIDATMNVYFLGLMGDPNSTVIQTARVSEFGRDATLPAPFNENSAMPAVDLAVAAAKQTTSLAGAHAAGIVLRAIPKSERKGPIKMASIVAAAKKLENRNKRWFRPPTSMVNDYSSRVTATVSSTSVNIFATGNVGFGLVNCAAPLVPKGNKIVVGSAVCLPANR